MNDLMAIAQNTFSRLVRQKSLYVILGGCLVIVWAMGLYGPLSNGRDQVMMLDAALAISLIVGMLSALSAAFEIPKELRGQTAQIVLSKPLGRPQFIVGKFAGIAGLSLFNVAIIAIGSAVILGIRYGAVSPSYYQSAVLIGLEVLILVGVGVLFSVFMSDIGAAIGVFLIFVIGHSLYMLVNVFESGVMNKIFYALANILPNFNHLDFKTLTSAGIEEINQVMPWATAYGLSYTVALVALAVSIFSFKDIK
jgi:ABC-type transport system involved in multi-copper enzyme maturation permease subunit